MYCVLKISDHVWHFTLMFYSYKKKIIFYNKNFYRELDNKMV